MRRETPENQQHHSSCYGAGTRVEAHRSRYELEHVLQKYGADDVLLVEADANAAIQFEMHGRYVQLPLPLPDPHDARFTHTPSGKPRTLSAQERAYDQALREHWRSLVVAVRGKLQSVESGISTFEQEFDRFLVPHFAEEKRKRNRRPPKVVNWLLGGSHSLAIALVAAFLVPASAVGAFAIPTNVVGSLAAPFRSAVVESASANQGGKGLALARGGWSASGRNVSALSPNAGRLFALRSNLLGEDGGQLRHEASLSTPPDGGDAPAPQQPELASSHSTPLSDAPPTPPTPPPNDNAGGGADDAPGPVIPPEDSGDTTPADTRPSDTGDQPAVPSSDDSTVSDPVPDDAPSAGEPGDDDAGTSTDAPPDTGDANNPGNGNGNANGQNSTQGQGNGNDQGQGNGNGNANGQNGSQGQGNGQKTDQGNGKSQGNGKGKGGK